MHHAFHMTRDFLSVVMSTTGPMCEAIFDILQSQDMMVNIISTDQLILPAPKHSPTSNSNISTSEVVIR